MKKSINLTVTLGGALGIILALVFSGIPQVQYPNFARASPIQLGKVPLDTTDPNASPTRDYDHATVAINSDRDIVVAFHSSRTDISIKMKQVEIAYYQWQVGDTWLHKGTKVLGATTFNPLQLQGSDFKCERPDVVAVDDKFFVVWTRRYENVSGHPNQPAVMECAWVDLDSSPSQNIRIHQNGLSLGQGVELDAHAVGNDFWVKECGGVPDAVPLKDTGSPYKVAVVYAHQTQFSGATLNRKFQLRVVTCELNSTTFAVTKGTAQPQGVLVPQIQFNGISSASGSSGGLILPEVAVSSEDNAFWLAAERQIEVGAAKDPEGKIYLGYWKFESGAWTEKATRTYQSAISGDAYSRRRPMISAYPEAGQNDIVALTFNKIDLRQPPVLTSKDVIYKQVEYDPSGSLGTPTTAIPQWPNSTTHDDLKPSPIQGRSTAAMARAYAGRSQVGGTTQDLINNQGTVVDTSVHITGARPALSYYYEPSSASPDYTAITWEKKLTSGGQLQVWVGVE